MIISGIKAIVTIEREKSVYQYDLFKTSFDLTNREIEIIKLISKGYSNTRISKELFISEKTVKKHISNIFEKTATKSRSQLIFLLSQSTRKLKQTSQ
ncbi:MAG: response regulator transcription factor [Spirochaetales bacterium]|nr:response regulator transcription factor [Spirochaetales bacterium]